MTLLKIKIILAEESSGRLLYIYPSGYDSRKINILAYGEEAIENNERVRYCIGIIEDIYKNRFSQTKKVVVISEKEADTLCKKWRPSVLKIANEKVVVAILNKIKNGILLIGDEINAIDPENTEVLGINYSKKFNIKDYIKQKR